MQTDWTDILLLHLLRDPKTIERLQDKLEPADITEIMMDANKGFLWKCSRDYYLQSGQPIPQQFMEARLAERIGEGAMQQVSAFRSRMEAGMSRILRT